MLKTCSDGPLIGRWKPVMAQQNLKHFKANRHSHNKTGERICTIWFLIQFKQKKSCSKHGESELEQRNQCPENREKAHQYGLQTSSRPDTII